MCRPRIILASASPRRLELLRGLGLDPEPRPAGLSETTRDGETPEGHVVRLAEAKGKHVARGVRDREKLRVVLAADTAVVLDGEILGKPADRDEARSMLRKLAGKNHQVLTGVFVARTDDLRSATRVEVTRVRFRNYSEAVIEWYVGTGEPMDKAGAYGIQGRGVLLSEGIDGSWTNVVGLPVERLPELFEEIGLTLTGLL